MKTVRSMFNPHDSVCLTRVVCACCYQPQGYPPAPRAGDLPMRVPEVRLPLPYRVNPYTDLQDRWRQAPFPYGQWPPPDVAHASMAAYLHRGHDPASPYYHARGMLEGAALPGSAWSSAYERAAHDSLTYQQLEEATAAMGAYAHLRGRHPLPRPPAHGSVSPNSRECSPYSESRPDPRRRQDWEQGAHTTSSRQQRLARDSAAQYYQNVGQTSNDRSFRPKPE